MKHWIGTQITGIGHLVSSVGCGLRGGHVENPGYPNYCLICGRRYTHSTEGDE